MAQHRTLEAAGPISSSDNRGVTVLVTDNSVYNRVHLRQIFEKVGYAVIEAPDGIKALRILTADPAPNIQILDIDMPNLDGFGLLNMLRNRPDGSNCKTIMLTSRSSEQHRQRALSLGAYAFLSKPCTPEVLLETVRKALNNSPLSI